MKLRNRNFIRQKKHKISWTRPLILAGLLAVLIIALVWQWSKQVPIAQFLPTLPKPTQKTETIPQITEIIEMSGKNTKWRMKYPPRWQVTAPTNITTSGVEKTLNMNTITNYRVGQADRNGIPNDAVHITVTITTGGNGRNIDTLVDCGGKTLSCETITINGHPFRYGTAMLNSGVFMVELAGVRGEEVFRFVAAVYPGPYHERNKRIVEQVAQSITLLP